MQVDRINPDRRFIIHHITSLLTHSDVKGHVANTLKHFLAIPTITTNAPLDSSSVVNLSNVTLTDKETQLLARGLSLCS